MSVSFALVKHLWMQKPVFAICHGPQLLITAQTLEGRDVTGYKSIEVDLKTPAETFMTQRLSYAKTS